MAAKDLQMIAHALRNIALSRWTDNDIMKHVVVRLPAPIFDRLVMDVKAEMPAITAAVEDSDLRGGNEFTFGGIKYERVDGRYWSVNAAAARG